MIESCPMSLNSFSYFVATGVTGLGLLGDNPLMTIVGVLSACFVMYAQWAKAKRDLSEKKLMDERREKLEEGYE